MTNNKILAAAALAAISAAGLAGCSNDAAPPAPAPAPYAEGTTVTLALLETTDLHANVMSYNYYSLAEDATLGVERTATLVQAAR
eukprot:gene30883-38167_t